VESVGLAQCFISNLSIVIGDVRPPSVKFEVFTAVIMKNAIFWDIRTQFVPQQETSYASATDPSRLMLCKILGLHGGDYE
jgi:hypothetical protein